MLLHILAGNNPGTNRIGGTILGEMEDVITRQVYNENCFYFSENFIRMIFPTMQQTATPLPPSGPPGNHAGNGLIK
jgi:hypothetical protein